MSRKNAFEKKAKGDIHKTSLMSPPWMQTQAKRDDEKLTMFKARPLYEHNTRGEKNRVLLADSKEPPKSIYNLG